VFALPSGYSIIAVGQSDAKRRTLVLSQQDNRLVVCTLSKRGRVATRSALYASEAYQLPSAIGDVPLRPLGVLADKFCFIDAAGKLVVLDKHTFQMMDARPVVASRAVHGGLFYLRLRPDFPNVQMARLQEAGEIELTSVDVQLPAMPDARYYFGAVDFTDLVAYSPSLSRCAILHRRRVSDVAVPKTLTVVGMVEGRSPNPEPLLIAIDDSRTRIEAIKPGGRETLVTTAAPLAFVAASDVAPVVAFLTQSGELGVYSCAAKAMVLHATGGPE
jgi:hypothetical protein